MRRDGTFPQWKGYENKPQGTLLEQVVDMDRPMGIAYERSCEFYKDFHTHSRVMFVLPRGACRMEIRSEKPRDRFLIDQSSVLVVPTHVSHDDEGKSAIYDTVALFPDERLLKKAEEAAGMSGCSEKLKTSIRKLKRSEWLDRMVQEYFFRRIVNQVTSSAALDSLEQEITAEILRCAAGGNGSRKMEPRKLASDSVAQRALKYIETHLFEPIDLASIAKHSGASISTLTRALKATIKQTPYIYIRNRRLDESKELLRKGGHSIGEVALLVGYRNFGAFSEAFKLRFRKPPSAFLP